MAKQKYWNGTTWEVVGTDAAKVSVADPQNKIAATNVEDALLELFTFANNGKSDIASVIGSPATSGNTFAQLKAHIQNSKNDLATNLTAKGQASAGTERLEALVDKVALVNTGKKWASGEATAVWASGSGSLTINGLAFTPRFFIITLKTPNSTKNFDTRLYTLDDIFGSYYSPSFYYGIGVSQSSGGPMTGVTLSKPSGSYSLPMSMNDNGVIYKWWAYEG
jgi:hypothetical protein